MVIGEPNLFRWSNEMTQAQTWKIIHENNYYKIALQKIRTSSGTGTEALTSIIALVTITKRTMVVHAGTSFLPT